MHKPKELVIRKLSRSRLLKYIERTSWLTASQYGRLLNKPYGTISATLYKLAKEGVLIRQQETGATQSKNKSWRYCINNNQD